MNLDATSGWLNLPYSSVVCAAILYDTSTFYSEPGANRWFPLTQIERCDTGVLLLAADQLAEPYCGLP